MIALGLCAAGGLGASLVLARKKSRLETAASDRLSEMRGKTDAMSQALDALLLDRADGAAIWAGRKLHMAIGAAEPLTALPEKAGPTEIANSLAAPAFSAGLADSLQALLDEGVPFESTVNSPRSGSCRIVGRTLGGRALVSIIEGAGDGRALTADEARLRRADILQGELSESFHHAPIIAWRRDADGAPVWVNQAYIEAVEASTMDDVIENQTELVFGDEATLLSDLAARARTVGRPQTIRAATVIGGSKRTLEFKEVPVTHGTLGFATDITAQVIAADALRRQIEANELTLDRLHRGVAVFSKDLTLSYSNDAVASLWGIDPAFLQSRPSLRDVLNALRERSKVPQARNFATWRAETLDRYSKLTEAHETHWHLPNGVVLHLLAQPHPLGGILLMVEDVTDFFEMKREMVTVSAVQEAAFARLSEGVLVLGLDGRRRLSNDAFGRLWNLEPTMLEDAHIREIATLCEPLFGDEGVWSRMTEFVSGATEARGTWHERLHRSDDSVLAMAGTVLPDGATMFAFTDVTDSVNKQRALVEQNEKLEELSGLKSAFLDGIHGASQELKIPLNTIIGFSEILSQELFGDLNAQQRDYIKGVSTAANDLRLLVTGITDLAMIQADDFPFRVEMIHLKSVIDATVRFIERNVSEPTTLRVDCPDNIGEVPGDAPRFREIMHNLINAVRNDAGLDQVIEIGVRRQGNTLVLWIGAEDAELSGSIWKVLEKSLHGMDPPPLHRDGLGITLVQQFVERQGGTIGLEKNVGGTREAVVCRFLTDEALVRAASSRRRAKTESRDESDSWDDSDSASQA
jgi:signal transduction histidine kinase